jgi:hypothetical protein
VAKKGAEAALAPEIAAKASPARNRLQLLTS